ncbi:energy-coupling factor transporter transmembrane protein EcfT [candidate division KSB1 bacterium]|nr:energy-coupling factor transporter transmembrane protein EcfT [candidate division KSB1 bacterium]
MSEITVSRRAGLRKPNPPAILSGCLALVATAPFVTHWAGFTILLIMVLAASVLAGVETRKLARSLFRMWPFLVFALAIQVLSTAIAPPDATGSTGTLHAGVAAGVLLVARLSCVVMSSALVLMAYPADEYGRWLSRTRFGGHRMKRKLSQLGLVVTMALGFVPTLRGEFGRIRLAWECRGVATGHGRVGRLRALQKMLFPLLVSAFRRADQTSLALQARGYDPNVLRTHMRDLRAGAWDWIEAIVIVTSCVAALMI